MIPLIIVGIIIVSPFFMMVWDSAEKKKRESDLEAQLAQHTTEKISDINTYQNKNISNEEVMEFFKSQCKLYLGQCKYFFYEYKVYQEKDRQNYAWAGKKIKNGHYTADPLILLRYNWTFYHVIHFYFSNGYFNVLTTDHYFPYRENALTDNNSVRNSCAEIDIALNACRHESVLTWKIHGKKPSSNLPFNFYLLSQTKESSGAKGNKRKTDTSSKSQSDTIAFYRNLLGLKLSFTKNELKAAYHKAAEKYHPDRYTSASNRDRENAETFMKQVNEAYEILHKYRGTL